MLFTHGSKKLAPLFLALTLPLVPPAFAAEDGLAGCREELIFQIVRPKLGHLLRDIRKLRTLVAALDVDSAETIPRVLKTHLPALTNGLAGINKLQHAIRGILQDALKARVSKRKEQTDELVHDLGNVLVPIGYSVAILENKDAVLDHKKYKMILAMMTTGLEKGEKLIKERILPVISEARFVPQKSVVNVYDVLNTVQIFYRTSEPTITVKLSKTPLTILVNELALFTALSNLCKNAQEAIMSHQGGRGGIVVRAFFENGFVVVEVKDNGPGIPEDAQVRMLNRNESAKGEGRGVGLSSVQRTVFDNDGDFFFQSSTKPDDHGSLFQLRFPPAREAPAETPTAVK